MTKSQRPRPTNSRQTASVLAELIQNMQLVWRLLLDPRVSFISKTLIPLLTLLYLVSPIDLLPDVFPILGQLDDLAILLLSMRLFIELAPSDVVSQHKADFNRNAADRSQPQDRSTDDDQDVIDAEYRVMQDG